MECRSLWFNVHCKPFSGQNCFRLLDSRCNRIRHRKHNNPPYLSAPQPRATAPPSLECVPPSAVSLSLSLSLSLSTFLVVSVSLSIVAAILARGMPMHQLMSLKSYLLLAASDFANAWLQEESICHEKKGCRVYAFPHGQAHMSVLKKC